MAINAEILQEIQQLMAALRDDFITEQETQRLSELLRSEPELRGLYIRYVAMEEHLRENLSDYGFARQPGQSESINMLLEALIRRNLETETEVRADSTLFGQVVDLSPEPEEETFHAPPIPAYSSSSPWTRNRIWLSLAALAALVLIAVTAIVMRRPTLEIAANDNSRNSSPTTIPSVAVVPAPAPLPAPAPAPLLPPVALISAENSAQWSGAAPTTDDLVAGKQLQLIQGCAELTFGSGAKVILQSPASIVLQSPSAVFLTDGSLTAHAPGGGFMVHTNGATVTDLGTEFGVAATPAGTVNVAVFQGSVAVKPQTGVVEPTPQVVAAGAAVQTDATGTIKPADANVALAFVRDEELQARIKAAQGSAYYRWLAESYQIRRDPGLVAYYMFENHAQANDRIMNMAATGAAYDAHLAGPSPLDSFWTEGRCPGKGAMTLPADGDTARLNIPVAFHDFTIIISVRLDTPPLSHSSELFSSTSGHRGYVFLGVDPHYSQTTFHGFFNSTVGALYMPLNPDQVAGHWTQFALVYDSAAQQACFYGQGKFGQKVHIDQWTDLTIGDALIGSLQRSATTINNRLQGAIDEIMVYQRALGSAEISQIYRDGQP